MLVLDFCGCMDCVLDIFNVMLLDVFNYNLENVLCIYCQVCLGVDYNWLLKLLECFKEVYLEILIKLGLMVGLGEINVEIIEVMCDLCCYGVIMLMFG